MLAADEVWWLQGGKDHRAYRSSGGDDPECVSFLRMAAKGHYGPGGGTKQGIYLMGPHGEYLEGAHAVSGNAKDLARRMELARSMWLWADSNLLSLTAKHLPGKDNVAADILSRGGPRAEHWSLNPAIVQMIWDQFGQAQVDLFADKSNFKCQLWYSLNPNDGAPLGTNAFGPDLWPGVLLYAFPPRDCLLALLVRFREQGGNMVLVAPTNEASEWFPLMCALVQGQRLDLPDREDALTQADGRLRSPPWVGGHRLAAWKLYAPGSRLEAQASASWTSCSPNAQPQLMPTMLDIGLSSPNSAPDGEWIHGRQA